MDLCWVTIRVDDMNASLHFYHDILGLKIDSRHTDSNMDMVMLGAADEPKIELLHLEGQSLSAKEGGPSIGLRVSSLDDAMELMKRHNIPIAREPMSPDPFTRFFFVNDPDGVTVQFVELKNHG